VDADHSVLSFGHPLLAPEALTVCAPFEISRRISAENSSGELTAGVPFLAGLDARNHAQNIGREKAIAGFPFA
jgi:hypothetical protein